MSSLWTDLLFLHGHIHDPELARRLADTPPPDLPGGKRQRTHSPLATLSSPGTERTESPLPLSNRQHITRPEVGNCP